MGKKAEAGIGSLILFIALILVAATAAAVFIDTSSSLQGKALTSASNTQKAVSTRVQIIAAWGENATTSSTISDLFMKIKLAPGSDAINLNNSIVGITTAANRQTYKFNQTSGCSPANISNLANINMTSGPKFMITPKVGYTKVGYLQEGDIIDVCVRLPANLTADLAISGSFTAQSGAPAKFSATLPSILIDAKIPLYP